MPASSVVPKRLFTLALPSGYLLPSTLPQPFYSREWRASNRRFVTRRDKQHRGALSGLRLAREGAAPCMVPAAPFDPRPAANGGAGGRRQPHHIRHFFYSGRPPQGRPSYEFPPALRIAEPIGGARAHQGHQALGLHGAGTDGEHTD